MQPGIGALGVTPTAHLLHLLPRRRRSGVTELLDPQVSGAGDVEVGQGMRYSITSSARRSSAGGMIKPSPSARWDEIDLADKIWSVPAARMKGAKEHRVPLSPRALALLKEMTVLRCAAQGELEGEAFLFPGGKTGTGLSNMAFLMLLRRMDRGDLTAHGFRSSFRDWASERTNFPAEAAEMALAHTVSGKVEAAYRRGDLFEKRRRLMDEWAKFSANGKGASRGQVLTMQRHG